MPRAKTFKEEHPFGACTRGQLGNFQVVYSFAAAAAQMRQLCAHERAAATLACPAEKRQAEAARIRDKYPDRIPVRTLPAACDLAPSMCCPTMLRRHSFQAS